MHCQPSAFTEWFWWKMLLVLFPPSCWLEKNKQFLCICCWLLWCICQIIEAEASTYSISRKCLLPSPLPTYLLLCVSSVFILLFCLESELTLAVEPKGWRWKIWQHWVGEQSWGCRERFVRGEKVGLSPPTTLYFHISSPPSSLLPSPRPVFLRPFGGFQTFPASCSFVFIRNSIRTSIIGDRTWILYVCAGTLQHQHQQQQQQLVLCRFSLTDCEVHTKST